MMAVVAERGPPTGGNNKGDLGTFEGVVVLIDGPRNNERFNQSGTGGSFLFIAGKLCQGPGVWQNELHIPQQYRAVARPESECRTIRGKGYRTDRMDMPEGGDSIACRQVP